VSDADTTHATHATPVVELAGIGKVYDGPPVTRALEDVSFRVDDGEYVGIVGPSGSGKSTLLNLIGALDRPSEGTLRIDGHDIGTMSDRRLSALRGRRIGFVFQTFNLIDGLDAVENVGMGMTYAAVPRAERKRRCREALDRVGLGARAGHRPSRMSGGERQRVAVARALVTEPALLLADEPTGNLDSRNGEAVLELFARLHDEGATIVLITHDTALAGSLPRSITIRDGHLVADTTAVSA